MDNNDSNIKPQSTGGLKLMTVFVVVLALHVTVILGMTAYYLMRSSPDSDMLTDQGHKSVKAAPDGVLNLDGSQLPDATDKSAAPSVSMADTTGGSTPAASSTPTPDQTASTATSTPAPASTDISTSMPTPASTPAPSPDSTGSTASTASTASTTPVASPAPTTPATTTASTDSTPSSLAPPPDAPVASQQTPIPFRTEPVTLNPPTGSASTTTASTSSVTPPVTTPATDSSSVATTTPYVVKPHDSLARIAHLNHTSVAKLKTANNLTSDLLHIGQKLVIPAKAPAVATTTPTPATTPDASTSATASTPTPSVATTDVSTPATDKTTVKPVTDTASKAMASVTSGLHHHVYTVVKGDTLTKIARKFNTTPKALMAANAIADPARLSIGKKLKIPSRESRSARNTEPAGVTPGQVQTKSAPATPQLANINQ